MFNRALPEETPEMELKDHVALRIKSIRQRRNLTQEQLAERVERSVDTISNLERGISLPSFETLERLAKVLQVPFREFFQFDDLNEGRRRSALLMALTDAARTLGDDDLEVAVKQVEALAAARGMAQTGGKASK